MGVAEWLVEVFDAAGATVAATPPHVETRIGVHQVTNWHNSVNIPKTFRWFFQKQQT